MNMTSDSPANDERKNSAHTLGNQAKVYAARMRLQNAIDQADALDAIREIAGNLIGTEEVAVFKIDKKRSELWLYWSSGVDPNKHSVLEVHREPRLKQVLSGKPVCARKRSCPPFFAKCPTSSATRVSCQTIALAIGSPRWRSHTTVVSR